MHKTLDVFPVPGGPYNYFASFSQLSVNNFAPRNNDRIYTYHENQIWHIAELYDRFELLDCNCVSYNIVECFGPISLYKGLCKLKGHCAT